MLVILLEHVKDALVITTSHIIPHSTEEVTGIAGFPDFGPNEETMCNLMFLTEFYRHAPGDTLDGFNAMKIFSASMQALFEVR